MAWLNENNETTRRSLDRQMQRAVRHLRENDPVIAELVKKHGRYRIDASRDPFLLMVGTIVSQQLSTKAANTIYARLLRGLGRKKPRPRHFLEAPESVFRDAGLSRSKTQYVRNVAEAFSKRRVSRARLAKLSDEDAMASLTEIKGVGEWSAHMFLMFGLNRLDIFPIGDVGLRNAMMQAYQLRRNTGLKRFERIADKWRPYRTVGSLYMWKTYDD